MSKKTFWFIVGAIIILALVWAGVKHMRTNTVVVSQQEVVEQITESGDPAEIPTPAVDM